MKITTKQLSIIYTRPEDDLRGWTEALNETLERFDIDIGIRIAAFLAQIGHESNRLRVVTENLNYSDKGLLTTFKKYFTPEQAKAYAKQPERIANRVYANRMGNGDEASGQGWKYRGRGLIQLTGRSNYAECSKDIGIDILSHPDLVTQAKYATLTAGWFWDKNNINALADKEGGFDAVTRRINGGLNGKEDRDSLYGIARITLGA